MATSSAPVAVAITVAPIIAARTNDVVSEMSTITVGVSLKGHQTGGDRRAIDDLVKAAGVGMALADERHDRLALGEVALQRRRVQRTK